MSENLSIFLALGGSAFISCLVGGIFNYFMNGAKARRRHAQELADEVDKRNEIIKRGVQALLRHDLYEIYNHWIKKGYCPNDVKNDVENMYNQYHNLGKNGVMDSMYHELLALPVSKEPEVLNEDKR